MSLEQITKFVHESIELNWRWKSIVLIGGEPTLHPQLFEILSILKKYKDLNPRCTIAVATNGFGPRTNEILSQLPGWVRIDNSQKQSNDHEFSSYNIAPIDLAEYKTADFAKGCSYIQNCGLGLTKYGYYPCGPGASVDRVFGFDIGLKKLSLLNNTQLKIQLKKLCQFCGHFKDDYGSEKITTEKMSARWQKAYKKYKKRNPKISRY
jgi:hypothetical protein